MVYSLSTHYAGQGLLDGFDFFTGVDPNNGFVDYQDKEAALHQGLVSVEESDTVRIGVDSANHLLSTDSGRPSVRLTSHESFNHGLFIADFAHMPASTCGTWPAFWAFNNDSGPAGGELDIIEGANQARSNLYSAYTSEGCQLSSKFGKSHVTGIQGVVECGPSQDEIGCNYAAPNTDTASYGDAFNAEGGGIYAWEWDSSAIRIWHFPRSVIPQDIRLERPDPEAWGPPQAIFGGPQCDTNSFFYNMSLAIHVNFCGDYAGKYWNQRGSCGQLAPTCEEWVAQNPESFRASFWDINYIDVYSKGNQRASDAYETLPRVTSTMPVVSGTRTITLSDATAKPTDARGTSVDPVVIERSSLLGCFESRSGFDSFGKGVENPGLDNRACVSACQGFKFAASYDSTCFCVQDIGDAYAVGNSDCSTPCAGGTGQFCGGQGTDYEFPPRPTGRPDMSEKEEEDDDDDDDNSQSPPSAAQRESSPDLYIPQNNKTAAESRRRKNIRLTIYGALEHEDSPPGAPAKGRRVSPDRKPEQHDENTDCTEKEENSSSKITTVVTVFYTTVCPSDPASVVEVEYSTTMAATTVAATQPREEEGQKEQQHQYEEEEEEKQPKTVVEGYPFPPSQHQTTTSTVSTPDGPVLAAAATATATTSSSSSEEQTHPTITRNQQQQQEAVAVVVVVTATQTVIPYHHHNPDQARAGARDARRKEFPTIPLAHYLSTSSTSSSSSSSSSSKTKPEPTKTKTKEHSHSRQQEQQKEQQQQQQQRTRSSEKGKGPAGGEGGKEAKVSAAYAYAYAYAYASTASSSESSSSTPVGPTGAADITAPIMAPFAVGNDSSSSSNGADRTCGGRGGFPSSSMIMGWWGLIIWSGLLGLFLVS